MNNTEGAIPEAEIQRTYKDVTAPLLFALKERIAYLAQQETAALLDIDGVPIGSAMRRYCWDHIRELGFRKNELQRMLKTLENIKELQSDILKEQQ